MYSTATPIPDTRVGDDSVTATLEIGALGPVLVTILKKCGVHHSFISPILQAVVPSGKLRCIDGSASGRPCATRKSAG